MAETQFHVSSGSGITDFLEVIVGSEFDEWDQESILDWIEDNEGDYRERLDADRSDDCSDCPFSTIEIGILVDSSPARYYDICSFLCKSSRPNSKYLDSFFDSFADIISDEFYDLRQLDDVRETMRVEVVSDSGAVSSPAAVRKNATRVVAAPPVHNREAEQTYQEIFVAVDRKSADNPAKLKGGSTMKKGMLNLDGMMAKFIQKTNGVVLDMTTGKIGIKDNNGTVVTLMEDANKNLIPAESVFDLSMEIPAYAIKTSLDKIKPGDIILTGKTGVPQFVGSVDLAKSQVKLIKTDGHVGTQVTVYNPLFGGGSLLVVPNMLGAFLPNAGGGENPMGNMMQMLMISKMLGNDDAPFDISSGRVSDRDGMGKLISTMLTIQMMGGLGGIMGVGGEGSNPMLQMALMQKMLGNDNGGDNMMETMMLMQMFSGGGANGLFGNMFGGAAPAPAPKAKAGK